MTDPIQQAWAAVSDEVSARLVVTGEPGHLPSRFMAEEVAVASVGVALLAGAALADHRGTPAQTVTLDRGHVADAVRSERFFRLDGQFAGAGFAPLSRFWRAADGWVRTHANYPWHRRALLDTLGTSEDPDHVAAALAELSGEEIEERVFAGGGIAAAVRTADAWRAHPQGEALAAEPLIGHRMIGDADPRRRPKADLPMDGVRVLDLTRVIAGPVCTRFVAALGADVLRLDRPGHADMPAAAVADSLLGKRSALLDLNVASQTLHELLDAADVVVCGYRPGALDRFGLDEDSLAERHPGIVAVYLDAWGHRGPWAGRRGFDSVVQAPTGIAAGESGANQEDEPGALPCQLLDHGTGYLAAAAVLDGVRRQMVHGGTHVRRLSLARTAMWLTSQGTGPTNSPAARPNTSDWLVELDSADGVAMVVAPPGALGDQPLRWPFPLTGYGNDPPRWLSR